MSFLILVAAPLALYLIIVLFSVQEIEPTEADIQRRAAAKERAAEKLRALELERRDAESILTPAQPDKIVAPEFVDASRAISAPLAVSTTDTLPDTQAIAFATQSALPVEITAPQTDIHAPLAAAPTDAASDAIGADTAAVTASVSKTSTAQAETTDDIISASTSDRQPELSDAPEALDEFEASAGPLQLPPTGSPKFAFDYRGRLWIEKKQKGFFRQLRRPQLPPEEPKQ